MIEVLQKWTRFSFGQKIRLIELFWDQKKSYWSIRLKKERKENHAYIYIYKSLWYECGIRKDSPSWFPLRRAFLACSSLSPAIAICRVREKERDGVYITCTCVVFVSGFPFLSHEREKERGEESKFNTSAISN